MKTLLSFIVCLFILSFANAQEAEPFSFWWRGNIAGAAFEMQVNLNFSKESEGCVSLSGEYFYLSTFKPMAVEGKYCPAAKTLIIRRNDENGLPKETFTFPNFDGKKAVGTWTKDNRAEVVEIETVASKERSLFLDKVVDLEKANWLVRVEQSAKMAYDIPNDANMEGDYSFAFYARGVRIATLFSGTYMGIQNIYQILPEEQELTMMYVYSTEDFRLEFDDAGEEVTGSRCDYMLRAEIWRYTNEKWVLLYSDNLFDISQESAGCGVFYAISSSKSIAFLGDNDKPLIWDWNGKELKQRK